jgi:hypothetical protein
LTKSLRGKLKMSFWDKAGKLAKTVGGEVQKSMDRQNERRANLEAKSDAELRAMIQNNSFLASEAEKDVARAILRRRGY